MALSLAEVKTMESTDPLIRLLEECGDEDQPAFTLVYSCGELDVTPRHDASARPVIITRDATGYTVTYESTSSRWTTPERTATVVHCILGTARLVRA